MTRCLKCKQPINSGSIYGLHNACFLNWFDLPTMHEFKDLDPKKGTTSSGHPEIKRKIDTFFHGKYLKYSGRLNDVEYILKMQEDDYPDLPAMEYTCNRIATILGLQVPPYYLIEFQGLITFVTRNFMQDHVGTLNHIYKFLPEGEDYHCCSEIIKIILEQTGRLSEVVSFVEMCLFDAFIGNNDRHGRNLGIIETVKFKSLAPMYDNPSFYGTETEKLIEAHLNPSGSIWTKKSKEPKVNDYIEEFVRGGLEKICQQFKKKVVTKFPLILAEVQISEVSEKRKRAFIKFLEKKLGEFENAKI